MILCATFLPAADFGSDGDGASKAPCEVLSNTSSSYSDEGGQIYELVFDHEGGQGVAYTYDAELMGSTTCMQPNGAPERIRPVGSEMKPFGAETLFVLVFVLGGLAMIIGATVMKRRHIARIMEGTE
ncbi:MAG TPA: hypothetical protein QGF58_18475 [Myxococcota bacterium]|nr:hypothetical protein [Myxococcota bacterium]